MARGVDSEIDSIRDVLAQATNYLEAADGQLIAGHTAAVVKDNMEPATDRRTREEPPRAGQAAPDAEGQR